MNLKQWIKRKTVVLYSKIVREKASPEYIARGWAIGMFCGCLIPFGFQLVCSIPAALLMKGSKIGATVGTLLTNHFTIFIIYPAQCFVGNRLMGGNLSYAAVKQAMKQVIEQQSWESLSSVGTELVSSFFIGGALLTAVMTPIAYYAVFNIVVRYRKKQGEKTSARSASS